MTLNNDGHGTASADKVSYYEGETAILTISASEHYHFNVWTGEDNGNINQTDDTHFTYTVGIENRTFTATFAEDTKYTLTLNNDGHGTASADKASYYAGETATITVTPASHYHFNAWSGTDSGNISGSGNTFTYTVGTTDRIFTATFAEDYIGGNCEENGGTNLTWQFNPDNGTLTVTGIGIMESYASNEDMPWYDYREDITATVISERADQTPLFTWLISQSGKDVTLNRTFYADGCYNSICLPFDLSADQLLAALPNASLFAFDDATINSGTLQLELTAVTSLTAGIPYLVRFPASEPDIVNPTFTNVQVTAAAGLTVGTGDVRFVGVLKPNRMLANDENRLMVGENNGVFWVTNTSTMRGFRAYFDAQTGGSSPIRRGMPARVVERGQTPATPTGLEEEDSDARVRKYIVNGRLVIERGGVRYDATGNEIR